MTHDAKKVKAGKARWKGKTKAEKAAHVAMLNARRKKISEFGKKTLAMLESSK